MTRYIRNPKDWLLKAQEIARLGNWDQDPETGELWWSDQTYQLFDLDPDQDKINFERFLEMVHPDDRELILVKTARALSSENHAYKVEYRITIVGQPLRHVYEEARVERDEQDKPLRIVGIIQDITQRKEDEEELKAAYLDLKNSQSQLLHADKMASIGQLAAGVAHEINNPVGYIISNLGSLAKYFTRLQAYVTQQNRIVKRSEIDADSASQMTALRKKMKIDFMLEDLDDLIQESQEGAQRVATIVRNLKNFSRIDEHRWKPTNLNESLKTTLMMVNNELKYKATISTEFSEIPLTLCDAGELNQVFMNLLVNAGQSIATKGKITVRTWHENRCIFISVADTGKGIPPESLSRIFEPFYTTKAVGQGTGLGLSIAYDIITKHNGSIHVCSTQEEGSQFTVKIPVIAEQESPLSGEAKAVHANNHGVNL